MPGPKPADAVVADVIDAIRAPTPPCARAQNPLTRLTPTSLTLSGRPPTPRVCLGHHPLTPDDVDADVVGAIRAHPPCARAAKTR